MMQRPAARTARILQYIISAELAQKYLLRRDYVVNIDKVCYNEM